MDNQLGRYIGAEEDVVGDRALLGGVPVEDCSTIQHVDVSGRVVAHGP